MQTYIIESPLMNSEGEAVHAALSMSHVSFDDIGEVHVHVISIVPINDKWRAVLQIVLGPSLDRKNEGLETRAKVDRIELEPAPAKLDKEDSDIEELGHILDIVPEYRPAHVYIEEKHGNLNPWALELQQSFPKDHFHFMAEGSLWEASRKLFPDIDFTIEAVPVLKLDQPQPEPVMSPELKPKPKKLLDLTHEA